MSRLLAESYEVSRLLGERVKRRWRRRLRNRGRGPGRVRHVGRGRWRIRKRRRRVVGAWWASEIPRGRRAAIEGGGHPGLTREVLRSQLYIETQNASQPPSARQVNLPKAAIIHKRRAI